MQRTLRKCLLLMGIALVLSPAWSASAERKSVQYGLFLIRHLPVHVIQIDLSDPALKVMPAVAHDQIGRRESFFAFLSHYQPLAQISGEYFGLRDAIPIGDIVIDGEKLVNGAIGTALAVTTDNTASIIDIPHRETQTWAGYDEVIRGGIRLLEHGEFRVFPRSQGFHDPALFSYATRAAIGLRDHKHLLMVAIDRDISLAQLAGVMELLGCRDAMTLDGGASTGMAFGHRILIWPGRTVSDVLMVVARPPRPAPIEVRVPPLPPYIKPFKRDHSAPQTFPAPAAAPILMAELSPVAAGVIILPAHPALLWGHDVQETWMSAESLANALRFRYSKETEHVRTSWMWIFLLAGIPARRGRHHRRLRRSA